MTNKITPSVDYNSWFESLDFQLNKTTYQNSKVLKVDKQTNKKML